MRACNPLRSDPELSALLHDPQTTIEYDYIPRGSSIPCRDRHRLTGVIVTLDASDKQAFKEIERLLTDDTLGTIPFLVLSNQEACAGAMSASQVQAALNLVKPPERPCFVLELGGGRYLGTGTDWFNILMTHANHPCPYVDAVRRQYNA